MDNTQESVIEQELPEATEGQAEVPEPTGEKVDYFSLPKQEREQLKEELVASFNDDEQKAFEMGWSPKEMFRGKYKDGTDKPWVSATDFLNKVEKEAPIRNERIRTLSKENEEMKLQMRKLLDINKAKFERDLAHDEQLVNKELQEAEEYSDITRFKAATDKKHNIEREKLRLKSFEDVPVMPASTQPTNPEVSNWAARNIAIVQDPVLMSYATAKDVELMNIYPNMSLTERLELVTEDVHKRFSEKFPNERRTPAVDSARNAANFGMKPKVRGFSDLPDLEKQQAQYLIRKGIFKDEKDFLKTYEWKK